MRKPFGRKGAYLIRPEELMLLKSSSMFFWRAASAGSLLSRSWSPLDLPDL